MQVPTLRATPDARGEPRRLLLDPEAEAAFTRQGFVQVPLLDEGQVDELKAAFERLHDEPGTGFVPDYLLPDPELKRAADAALRPVVAPPVLALLDDAAVFMASFLMKWPDGSSALGLHRDWTYVDERRFRTAVVWIALDDTDDQLDNGPLRVLPGSHRIVPRWRGTHTADPFGEHEGFIVEHCMQEVPARAGDAVIMDNRLLHCSAPNRSGRPRLAAAVAVRPAEAELLHPYQHGDRIDLHRVDDRFFLEHDPEGLKRGGPPSYGRWAVAPAPPAQIPVEVVAGLAGVAAPARPSPAAGASPDGAAAGEDQGEVGETSDAEPVGSRVRRALVASVLRLNSAAIEAGADGPPVLDPTGLDWVERLEASWAEVRAEVDALLAADVRLPLMATLLGADQGDEGRWRALALVARGRVVERTARRLPATLRLVQEVPGLQSALLSSFPPGMHLPAHRGPNKGVLRYHLGIVVPEPAGACGLRVGDRTVAYAEGRSILFDDTYEHEAWNHTSGERISLFLEVRRPLPGPLRLLNDGVQGFYGVHPEATGVADRAEELDVALNGRLPA